MPQTRAPLSAEILETVLADLRSGREVGHDLLKVAEAYVRLKEVAQRYARHGSVLYSDLQAADRFFSEYPELLTDELREVLIIRSPEKSK